jgi:hypothetical protein
MSGDVVGVARRRVAGEAGFDVQLASQTFAKAGCATYPPVDADLECAVVMHSTFIPIIAIKPARALPSSFRTAIEPEEAFHFAEVAGYAERS